MIRNLRFIPVASVAATLCVFTAYGPAHAVVIFSDDFDTVVYNPANDIDESYAAGVWHMQDTVATGANEFTNLFDPSREDDNLNPIFSVHMEDAHPGDGADNEMRRRTRRGVAMRCAASCGRPDRRRSVRHASVRTVRGEQPGVVGISGSASTR